MRTVFSRLSTLSTKHLQQRCFSSGQFATHLSAFSKLTHGVTPLTSFGIIRVHGRDAETFLQGMISNNIDTLNSSPNTAIYSGILSPQGRFLYDCLVTKKNINDNTCYVLECDSNETDNVINHLKKYKLRSKVKFENESDKYRIWSLLGPPKRINAMMERYSDITSNLNDNNKIYIDPRCSSLGIRLILDVRDIPSMIGDSFAPIGEDFYHCLRNLYGIPQFNQELFNDKSIILEENFQLINGVSFSKGCYVGQELIARTHHRGVLRKRLFPATIIPKNSDNDGQQLLRKLDFDENDLNRDTIFPQWFSSSIEQFEQNSNVKMIDFEKSLTKSKENISITNNNNNNNGNSKRSRSNGKIMGNTLNNCIVQLRNEAFQLTDGSNGPTNEYLCDLGLKYNASKDENNSSDDNDNETNSNNIDWNEYKLVPHLPPYMHDLHSILTRNQG